MITRGSKVAAEKCGREIESGTDMGSPDRREPISSPDMQESPLYKYLSNLSPIKPAKSVHHAQTYNELTFPPEPRIFASPRSSRRSSTSSLKRVLAAERSSAQAQAEGRESLGWHRSSTNSRSSLASDIAPSPRNNPPEPAHQGVASSSRTQTEETPASQSTIVKIESIGNEVYLSENLAGQGMFAMNAQLNPDALSSQMDRTAASAASFQTQFMDFQQMDSVASEALPSESGRCMEPKPENSSGGARSEHADGAERVQSSSSLMPQIVDSMVAGNLSQESKCREHEHHRSLSIASSSQHEDHTMNFNVKCEGDTELDQDTTAMAYFLAGDQDLGQEIGEGDWSEDSGEVVVSRLPLPSMSEYSENQSDMIIEENTKQENSVMDAITSQSGHRSSSCDGQDAATEDTSQHLSMLPQRAETTGQRGIRRRCLDFDASVARRKSLGSMGGRKSLGSRLKDSSGSSSAADANNTCSALTDMVAATSDATASGLQASAHDPLNANDAVREESNSGGPPTRGVSGSEGDVGTSRRMQLASCSFKKNIDALNTRTADASKSQDFNSNSGGAPIFNTPESRRSPPVRPTGIGLHLNSLTSRLSFKREYQSAGSDSSKGVMATVLGIQPLAAVSPKEDTSVEEYEKLGLSSSGGLSAMLNQNFSPGVASLLERRNQLESNADDPSSLSNKRMKIPIPDFRSLNIESMAPLEESLPVTAGEIGMSMRSPIGQKRSQPHPQELLRLPEGETADDFLDSPQSSKKRRRKSIPATGDKSGESCKRCNCKKSKCLKLYCECFAAGVYCVGSCACRDCFNKPEFADTVLNTRQQIESRNPLAFAPKIVQAAESSPTPGDEALDTPASARHKRGCNCKKSLCLKKYCECYQAGVGCSEGCRCEGCKNMYGRKEGPEEGEEKESEQANSARDESQTEDPIELLNRMSGKSDRLRDSAKQNLSPITPTFDYDGLGRSMLRLRSTGRKRAASDEHCASPLPQPGSRPSKSPTRFSHTLDALQFVSYPQGEADFSMSGGGDSPMTTPTFARIGHLSPRWEGLDDICTLTPLPLAPLRPTPGSSNMGTMERPNKATSFSRQITEPAYHGASSASGHHHTTTRVWSPHRGSPRFRQPAPRSPLRFDTPRQSQQSVSDQSHPTPLTPSLQSSPLTGKNLESELESVKATSADDDDTPDFLKYTDDITSPSRTTVTKSGSPKQKRVTPPRYGGNSNSREQASSRIGGGKNQLTSSPGLRNSRKFILQALPSLPPVTPPFSNG